MASISGLNSSMSSIYGSRNVLTGLASGMDTESMIENAISGYKMKITALQQKRTRVEWQQEAYRSIIEKLSAFSNKYTSYQSSTNLMSPSFFNSAVKVSTAGKYADLVSASGKTNSDVQILGVKQLAKAATYTVTGLGNTGTDKEPSITGGEVDLSATQKVSNVSGSMTINYGGNRSYTVDFGEMDIYESADELAKAIDEKLSEQTMTLSDGTAVKANEKIGVKVNGDSIEFFDKGNAGNNVYISSASGKIEETLGIDTSDKPKSLDLSNVKLANDNGTVGDYLSGKELQITLDGVTKKIKLPDATKGADFLNALQDELNKSFGDGKIRIDKTKVGTDGKFTLDLAVDKGSTMSVTGSVSKALGLGESGTTYVDTRKTLGQLLDDNVWASLNRTKADGKVVLVPETANSAAYYKDAQGSRVAKADDGEYYRVDAEGEFLYEFKVNDEVVGQFNKNTTLESVMTAINGNPDVGVKVSYSKTTNQFQFAAKESGSASRVEMGDGLAQKLFGGGTAVKGQDAILSMSVNGQELLDISRSSNTFDVDGLSVNLKGTFNVDGTETETVTFTSTSDSDKIVDAVKAMVEDYNAMATEIKNAYSKMPAQKYDGTFYAPLTDEEKEGMTESAIESYEEQAKQGLLFADRDLSSLYNRLLGAISMSGSDGAALKSIGITTSYSNGLTTLNLDENKLRASLEATPDKVRDIFSKTQESGASTNGLMQALKTPLDMYGKTSGGKGILVEKAGSPLAPSTMYQNTLQKTMDNYDKQMLKWQEKMNDQIDRYTSKFSQLEQLIAQMNSQSSAFSGLMGGY